MGKVFEGMTNLYSLSKTLRFELKPVSEQVKKNMIDNNILASDAQRDEDYEVMKKLFDQLHSEFITDSLEHVSEDWSDSLTFYQEYSKKVKDKKALSDSEKKKLQEQFTKHMEALRKKICFSFETTGNEWKQKQESLNEKGETLFKQKGYNILTEGAILGLLKKRNPDRKEVISKFDSFFTYFGGYNQNRENYYTHGEKSTAIAYRIVNQNLITFFNNIIAGEKIQEKIGHLLTEDEKNIFIVNHYNTCLTQQGIDEYNRLLGGYKNDKDQKVQGINERINLEWNQKLPVGEKKLPQLKQLYKQIGSLTEKVIPFVLIENDLQLKEMLTLFVEKADGKNKEIKDLLTIIYTEQAELDKIWISKTTLNILSNKYFVNWFTVSEKAVELKLFNTNKSKTAEERVTIPPYISLAQFKELLQAIPYIDQQDIKTDERTYLFKRHYEEEKNTGAVSSLRKQYPDNWSFFLALMKAESEKLFSAEERITDEEGRLFTIIGYQQARQRIEHILSALDKTNKEHKDIIKAFADSAIAIVRFLKLFSLKDETKDKDTTFYNTFDHILVDYPATKRYDAIRNYMTQKPYSDEKMKLNFDCSTLLAGWDKNKETQNLSVILKDDHKYYLAVMKKDNNKFFEKNPALYKSDNRDIIQKMEYKLLPGPNKMLPKCLMPGKDKRKYGATDHILSLYEKGSFKKGVAFNIQDLHDLIDFYKQGIIKYTDRSVFNFVFKNTKDYQDISQFYTDVERQGYKVSWIPVNKHELFAQADAGQVYLFEISSKDFEQKESTRADNLQTLYRKNIFFPQSNVKLNGEAEVFYRKLSLKDKEKIITKDKKREVLHASKHQRYTEDKILFHVPITLGFGNKGGAKFNQELNKKLVQSSDDIHVIGIDRGEKHLAFYSVINTKTGKIVEQGTLNKVGQDKDGKPVDYEKLLTAQAKTRLEARQNRDTIGNIKNLKEGYIGQVVKKIVDLVLKYDAMVVFEDLNGGFKRGRQRIEQSVYQKLELALAKKLNFLVLKDKKGSGAGSSINAYQLTPPINTFGDIKGKQRGVVLYTRANYTSTTDPVSGFRKNLYLKKTDKDDMKRQIECFDAIGYDETKQAYFFSYDPKKFTENRGGKARTIWSCVDRYRGSQNRSSGKREVKKIEVTKGLNDLFQKYGIERPKDMIGQLKNRANLSAEFYASLIWHIDVIMQIRNTGNEDMESDFIHSPVEPFFDSREYKKQCPEETTNSLEMPTSGDANGAYNIARKGLMMLERIKKSHEMLGDKVDLFISDEDWDIYITNSKPSLRDIL